MVFAALDLEAAFAMPQAAAWQGVSIERLDCVPPTSLNGVQSCVCRQVSANTKSDIRFMRARLRCTLPLLPGQASMPQGWRARLLKTNVT